MFEAMRINMDEKVERQETVPVNKKVHQERVHKIVKEVALRLIALAHQGISKEKAASKNHRLFLIEKEKDEFLQLLNEEIHKLERKAHLFEHSQNNNE